MRSLDTIKYLTQEELTALFRVIDSKRDKALFLIAYRHGLRATEMSVAALPSRLAGKAISAKVRNNGAASRAGMDTGAHPEE